VPDVALSELKRYMTGGELAGLPVAAEISAQETRGRLPGRGGSGVRTRLPERPLTERADGRRLLEASMAAVARRQQQSEGLRVAVHVRPGAARTVVGGRHGDALVVCVTARPTRGAATQAVLRAVAEAFAVPKRDVTLVTGATSRDKVIEVAGPLGPLARRLGELLGT
jgi:uncharacterized protein